MLLITYISCRNTKVTLYALQNDNFVDPIEIQELIVSRQMNISAMLGYDIGAVESNRPTERPVVRTVTRSIPSWAIALIVIVNSVIIISVLLIVLAMLWRRYTQ